MLSNIIYRGHILRIGMGIIILAILLLAGSASAATWTVDDSGGADFTGIQDAINNANVGDTILVYSGTYHQNVYVNKQLILKGIDVGEGKPVINVSYGEAVTVGAEGSMLEGFYITSPDIFGGDRCCPTGIRINSNNNIIRDNTVTNNTYGIYQDHLSNNMLNDNDLSYNFNGIALILASGNTLSGNNVTNNKNNGIYLDYSSDNTLSGNSASNNYNGIYLESSNNNTLSGNNASNNSDDGIELYYYSSNNTFNGNIASSNKGNGIYLTTFSNNNTLSDNNASNNYLTGIYLYDSSNNTIYNNYLNNNNALDNGNNIWNIPKTAGTNIIGGPYLGGNFWSGYTGTDANGDGLGDTPYSISGGTNKDYLPLIVPKPIVSISTDKYQYAPGEIMNTTISLKNPTASSVSANISWYLKAPDYGYSKKIMTKRLTLPPGYNQSFYIPITIGNWGAKGFNASWYIALNEIVPPYKLISEDTADWRYVPGARGNGEIAQIDIGNKIIEIAERSEIN